MEGQSKKFKDLKEDSNAIFQELFGFGKKTSASGPSSIGQVIKSGEFYLMGKSVITGISGVSEELLLNYDFENSPLSWMLDCEFRGDLTLKLTGNPELTTFSGKWYSGIFKGNFFGVTSEFLGGQFGSEDSNPMFLPPYMNWKTSPFYFYKGNIKRPSDGIIGIKNLPLGNISNMFNVLAIAPGNTVTIELNGGTKHSISCLRRMGGNSNIFAYKILNGKTGEQSSMQYTWPTLRGNSEIDFLKLTNINLSTASKSIALFGLDISEGIISAVVTDDGGDAIPTVQPQVDFLNTQQQFDLGKIPLLNIKAQTRGAGGKMMPLPEGAKGMSFFYVPDAQYLSKFKEAVLNISSGIFQKDLGFIRSALKNKIVTGYDDSTPYLANIFGVRGDNRLAPKEVKEALVRINDFVKFFVDRIFIQGDNSKEDVARQQLILDRIKQSLGVKEFLTPSTPEATPVAPIGKTTPKKGPGIKAVSPKNESVREMIKNIISENLKHF